MHTITFDQANQDFAAIIARVLSNAEPTVVVLPSGESVVVSPFGKFESSQETDYLLHSSTNAAHLLKSIAEAEAG